MKYSDWGSIHTYTLYIYICLYVCVYVYRSVRLGTTIIIIITCHAKNFDQSTATVACYGGIAIRTSARRITREILIVLYNIIAIFFLPITIYLHSTLRWTILLFAHSHHVQAGHIVPYWEKKIVDDRSIIFPRPRHCEQSGSLQ